MKNKKVATALAIITGTFGGHHFYLKNYFKGTLYLFFSWSLIPFILGIIEGITLLKMDENDFDNKYNKESVEFKLRLDAHKLEMLDKYGESIGQQVIDSEVWTDMTKEMLIDSLGEPSLTKENVLKNKIKEKWFYGQYYTERGVKKYKIEIKLEDNVVVGWREL